MDGERQNKKARRRAEALRRAEAEKQRANDSDGRVSYISDRQHGTEGNPGNSSPSDFTGPKVDPSKLTVVLIVVLAAALIFRFGAVILDYVT